MKYLFFSMLFSAFAGYEIAYFLMAQPTMDQLKKTTSTLSAMTQSKNFWYDQAHTCLTAVPLCKECKTTIEGNLSFPAPGNWKKR